MDPTDVEQFFAIDSDSGPDPDVEIKEPTKKRKKKEKKTKKKKKKKERPLKRKRVVAKPAATPKPKPKAKAKAAAKPKPKPKPKTAAKPKAKAIAKPKPKTAAKPKAKSMAITKPKTSAKPKAKTATKKKAKKKLAPPPPEREADVDAYTVPPGMRKSKFRNYVSDAVEDSALGNKPVATSDSLPMNEAPGMNASYADMPHLDGSFALDEWIQRFRDSAANVSSTDERRKSVAASIRESLRAEAVAIEDEDEDDDDDDVETETETKNALTIEEFFSGDVDTPLVGSAATMHVMLTQLREELKRNEALAEIADDETAHARDRKKGSKKDAVSVDDDAVINGGTRTRLEACSRAYCSAFFREARGIEWGERPCKRGNDCAFVMMAACYPDMAAEATNDEGFICREFLLPSQMDEWKKSGKLPLPQLCIGCNRMFTTFYYYMYEARGQSPTSLIQNHWNPVESEGDYDLSRCLYPNPNHSKWTGIARPIVEFAPNTFIYVEYMIKAKSGKTWKLLGVREEMTDFRLSPSKYYRAAAQELEVEARMASDSSNQAAAAAAAAAASTTLAEDARSAWVSGIPGAMMRGVPPCRPLRSQAWIEAEEAMCPPPPGAGALPVTVPRVLLGHAFPVWATSVFVPFSTTLDLTRTDSVRMVGALHATFKAVPRFHSFDKGLLEAIMVDAQVGDRDTSVTRRHYRILLAILWRVEVATRLSENTKQERYVHWLHLFIDTHIDLCVAMHEMGLFDDASLKDADLNTMSLSESVVDQNYPHDTRCIHAGDLPDLSACIQSSDVWFQVRSKVKAENVFEAIIHLIGCKPQIHKCQVRNFADIAYAYAKLFPQLLSLFRALIGVSLLGNYPHARKRPTFSARLRIVYGIRPEVMTDREMFLWMAENEQLIYAIVKEYYCYLVEQRPAFEVVMEETTRWSTVRSLIYRAMDRARSVLETSLLDPLSIVSMEGRPTKPQRQGYAGHGAPNTKASHILDDTLYSAVMRTISADLQMLHEFDELPLVIKLRKGPFSEFIYPEMTRFFNHTVMDEHIVRPQTSLTKLAESDGNDMAKDIVMAMREVVHQRMSRGSAREPLELRWISYFGVTSAGMAALRALCYDYETKDIADNSIELRVEAMYERCPRDFFIFHTFFKILHDWHTTAYFKLPLCYAESQAAALRAKTFTPPWEALSPNADVYYYCSSCLRWLSDVIDVTDPDTREYMYGISYNHTLYSQTTGEIYCDRQRVPVNTRKQVESGQYDNPDAHVEDISEAKKVRHYLGTPPCCSVPAVAVHMLGGCQRLGGKLWALCECCASITQWEGAKFGSNGFTCGFHDPDAPRNLTAHQKEALRLRRLRVRDVPSDKCDYCMCILKTNEDFTQITVLDDVGADDSEEPSWKFLPYTLCRAHGGDLNPRDIVMRLSAAEGKIHRSENYRLKRLARFTKVNVK